MQVSFQPLYDVVSRVAGEAAQVQRLVSIGASPHVFEPTVRDIARLRQASLVVMAGLGADSWLERLVKTSQSQARVLKLGDALKFQRLASGEVVDPHWWLDASLMAQACGRIAEELARLDPAHATQYRANGQREAQRLSALHSELQRSLRPIQGAKLVTFHNAFAYFARAYGLTIAATIAPLHDVEPSVQSTMRAVKLIQQAGVKAVFSEPQLPPGPAHTVAEQAKVSVYILDPEGSPEHPGYAEMMRFNRDTLLRAFAP